MIRNNDTNYSDSQPRTKYDEEYGMRESAAQAYNWFDHNTADEPNWKQSRRNQSSGPLANKPLAKCRPEEADRNAQAADNSV